MTTEMARMNTLLKQVEVRWGDHVTRRQDKVAKNILQRASEGHMIPMWTEDVLQNHIDRNFHLV